jgi:hypothetical protein
MEERAGTAVSISAGSCFHGLCASHSKWTCFLPGLWWHDLKKWMCFVLCVCLVSFVRVPPIPTTTKQMVPVLMLPPPPEAMPDEPTPCSYGLFWCSLLHPRHRQLGRLHQRWDNDEEVPGQGTDKKTTTSQEQHPLLQGQCLQHQFDHWTCLKCSHVRVLHSSTHWGYREPQLKLNFPMMMLWFYVLCVGLCGGLADRILLGRSRWTRAC